jgi:Domain of unknown function (DUF6438)
MRLFLLTVSLFALAACATTANNGQSIQVSEGACFGQCPIYDVTITPDNHYLLNGERFTRVNGFSEGDLGAGSYTQMERLLDSADFFNLPSEFTFNNPEVCPGPPLSDMPSITITWTNRRGSHTVLWYQGCNNATLRDLRDGLRDGFDYEGIVRPG